MTTQLHLDPAERVRDALRAADRMFAVNDDAATVQANMEHRTGKRIRDRFITYHLANPDVYRNLVAAARTLKAAGRERGGIGLLYERLRWLHITGAYGDEPFKLSNDFRAEYARLIMVQETDLRGFFRLRSLSRVM